MGIYVSLAVVAVAESVLVVVVVETGAGDNGELTCRSFSSRDHVLYVFFFFPSSRPVRFVKSQVLSQMIQRRTNRGLESEM